MWSNSAVRRHFLLSVSRGNSPKRSLYAVQKCPRCWNPSCRATSVTDTRRGSCHHRLRRVAGELVLAEPDRGFARNRDLQQKEISQRLGPHPDARAMAVIDERHALHPRPADADIERLAAADHIETMRHEQRADVLARGSAGAGSASRCSGRSKKRGIAPGNASFCRGWPG